MAISFVKHDLKESVEVYRGRNLHPLPPLPPPRTDRDRELQKLITDRDREQAHRVSHFNPAGIALTAFLLSMCLLNSKIRFFNFNMLQI